MPSHAECEPPDKQRQSASGRWHHSWGRCGSWSTDPRRHVCPGHVKTPKPTSPVGSRPPQSLGIYRPSRGQACPCRCKPFVSWYERFPLSPYKRFSEREGQWHRSRDNKSEARKCRLARCASSLVISRHSRICGHGLARGRGWTRRSSGRGRCACHSEARGARLGGCAP